MKNILVIGGSSGIGGALVQLLKEENQVFATYKSNPQDSDDKTTFSHYNSEENAFETNWLPDVLDGFVFCPGGVNLLPFGRIKEDHLLADFNNQVMSAVKVLQQVLPNLKKSENASVVFFSTVAVQTGFNFHSQVAICKGAIEGLTKSLAAEFAPKIRVNAIAPSLTKTQLTEKMVNTPEKVEANANRHPLKKIGEPKDIATVAAFLLSDNSKWMTGQVLHVDGGIGNIKN